MRGAEYVARMGVVRSAYDILVGNPEGKSYSEDLGVDGRIISDWILRISLRGFGVDSSGQDSDQWRDLVNLVMNFRIA